MWILSSPRTEFLFLYLPGFVSVIIAIFYPDLGETSLLYGLLATALIDSGHVYTTSWRTFLHPEEFRSTRKYLFVPLAFFLLFFVWHFSGMNGLWNFVVYATLFHHVRQVYGFSKWYQGLNKRSDKVSDYFLYALAVIPILAHHFRDGVKTTYYSDFDLFLYPNVEILKAFYFLYAAVLSAWVIRELRLWKKGIKEINRLLSVAFPAMIYGYCFLIGKTYTQILFPLLFIHGVSYVGVLSQTLHRTRESSFRNFTLAFTIVGLTAVIFGLSEFWLEENVLDIYQTQNAFMSLMVGLWLTPLFCHYYFDAMIWKKNHRESASTFRKLH